MKPGYKKTDAGVIPNEWDFCNLGDKAEKVGSGITPTGGERVYKQEGHPFVRSQNVGWGMLLMEDISYIDDMTHESFDSTEIKTDDVFLNITGASIGRSAVADSRVEGGNVNQHVCIIRTNQKELQPRFLNHFLLSRAGQQQIAGFQAGGNRQGLNFGQIRSFLLPFPPLPEQRAIATALSDVDALIDGLDKLITKKRDLKQAAMQQLLTGKTRLPGFNITPFMKTEIGLIPKDWNVKKLGNCCKIFRGGSPRPIQDYITSSVNGINWIKIGDVGRGAKYIDSTEEKIIPEGASRSRMVYRDDFLLSNSMSFGRPYILRTDGCIHDGWLVLQGIKSTFDSDYIYYQLSSAIIHHQYINMAAGSSVLNLNKYIVSSVLVIVPPISEQTAIAEVLSDMDTEIATFEARLEKTRAIKQGMMQELLTGRIRLI